MRSFPRTARRRLLAGVAVLALALGLFSAPVAQAGNKLKHRQHHVQGKIKHARGQLDESSRRTRIATARLSAATAQLARARHEVAVTGRKLDHARKVDARLKRALAAAQERLDRAEADLVAGQQDVDDQRRVMTNVIASTYEQGDPQLTALASLIQADSTTDFTWTAEGQNAIVDRQTSSYQALQAAQVLLEVRKDQVADAERQVQAKSEAAAAHVVVVRDLHTQARAAKAKVRETVQTRRHARQQALRARAHDRKQLAKLRKQEQHIKQLILAAARKSRGGYHGRTGGFLMRPVPGYITSAYGYRRHPIYHYWGLHDGDDFHAPCGTALHAAGTGTVISRYYSSVWGNRLYLYLGRVNGQNITVIYNHLSRYAVGRGAHVTRGQTIGYAGTTGWSTACHLHFTVMANGRAVNPVNWF